jgi:cytochrome oxidase assembly protein ShyY1
MLVKPRYLVVWLVVGIVAFVCCFAGVWQWNRLHEKHAENVELRTNNSDSFADVAKVLPLADAPDANAAASAAKFRQVTATGVYDAADQTLLRKQSLNLPGADDVAGGDGSAVGFYVLTPLRTQGGTVLVVRGFLKASGSAQSTPGIPAPPEGSVTVKGRIEPASADSDKFGDLPANQVDTINALQTQQRLGVPVLAGYIQLESGQPGVDGLTPLPAPDMSNPAGGAIEPQHLAYVIQWFVFALLALALPLILARSDMRQAAVQSGELLPTPRRERRKQATAAAAGQPRDPVELDKARRAAKLADRYGR